MGKRVRKVLRPIDRVFFGAVMGVVVFVLERLLARGTGKDAARTSS